MWKKSDERRFWQMLTNLNKRWGRGSAIHRQLLKMPKGVRTNIQTRAPLKSLLQPAPLGRGLFCSLPFWFSKTDRTLGDIKKLLEGRSEVKPFLGQVNIEAAIGQRGSCGITSGHFSFFPIASYWAALKRYSDIIEALSSRQIKW